MSNRLPWWLLVILGWVVILVVALEYVLGAGSLVYAAGMSGVIGIAWYVTLLGGTAITLALSIAIGRRMNSIASAKSGGCVFTTATPVLLLILFFFPLRSLLVWLLISCTNPYIALYNLLSGHSFR